MRVRVLVVLAAVLGGSLARDAAAVITVMNTNDAGAGSLRQAIADGTGQTIDFAPSLYGSTITLTSGELVIAKNLQINGAGRITVSGGKTSRVFSVSSGTVTLQGLTIRDGNPGGSNPGGGLTNAATLTLVDVIVTENSAGGGGGGISNVGTLTVSNSTISRNVATGAYGGGIDNVFGGSLVITNSTVSENVSLSNGGGIDNYPTNTYATIRFCTIARNRAAGLGGGIYNTDGTPGAVSIEGSIVSENRAGSAPNCSGTLASADYNLIRDATGCTLTGPTTNNRGGDPRLGALQLNGGAVPTHALRPGSDAMDKVPYASCGQASGIDARHLARPQDGTRTSSTSCDIGAYEARTPIFVNSLLDSSDFGKCTLRDAVNSANSNSSVGGCVAGTPSPVGDRIIFTVDGRIALTAGRLQVFEGLMIDGAGATRLTVSGEHLSNVFDFDAPAGQGFEVSGITIANGKADFGGGIRLFLVDDTLAVDGVSFVDNVGGGLYVSLARGAEVDSSSFSNTYAGAAFAAATDYDSPMTIRNSTFGETMSNPSPVFCGTARAGGSALLRLLWSTVRSTESEGVSVGVESPASPGSAVVEYRGSIVAGHGTDLSASGGGVFVSGGDNIIGDSSGAPPATGDQKSTDPLLGPLGYHGGQTRVFNLKPGSPARDTIPLARCGQAVDQRGFARPFGAACDIGAVERVIGGDVNGDANVNVADVFYLINFLFAGGPVPIGESDVNGDGDVTVADVFYLINRLFAGGAAPV